MKKLLVLLAILSLTACGGDDLLPDQKTPVSYEFSCSHPSFIPELGFELPVYYIETLELQPDGTYEQTIDCWSFNSDYQWNLKCGEGMPYRTYSFETPSGTGFVTVTEEMDESLPSCMIREF